MKSCDGSYCIVFNSILTNVVKACAKARGLSCISTALRRGSYCAGARLLLRDGAAFSALISSTITSFGCAIRREMSGVLEMKMKMSVKVKVNTKKNSVIY